MYTIKANSWQSNEDNSTSSITVMDEQGNTASVKIEGNKDVLQAALSKLEELTMKEAGVYQPPVN